MIQYKRGTVRTKTRAPAPACPAHPQRSTGSGSDDIRFGSGQLGSGTRVSHTISTHHTWSFPSSWASSSSSSATRYSIAATPNDMMHTNRGSCAASMPAPAAPHTPPTAPMIEWVCAAFKVQEEHAAHTENHCRHEHGASQLDVETEPRETGRKHCAQEPHLNGLHTQYSLQHDGTGQCRGCAHAARTRANAIIKPALSPAIMAMPTSRPSINESTATAINMGHGYPRNASAYESSLYSVALRTTLFRCPVVIRSVSVLRLRSPLLHSALSQQPC